jgi:hypothetical protein
MDFHPPPPPVRRGLFRGTGRGLCRFRPHTPASRRERAWGGPGMLPVSLPVFHGT